MRKISAALAAFISAMAFGWINSSSASALTINTWDTWNTPDRFGSQQCVTPEGGGTANGTVLTVWRCGVDAPNPYQLFYYRGSDGRIIHQKSGKCVTPQGGNSYDNGTVLTLWDCNSSDSQKFVVTDTKSYTQWGGKCVTPKGGSLANGVWLTLWDCNGDPSQIWY
uniref:RICIN domain-containing protein n=1 Tax=Streptomyces sp. CA-141956 TaxID=3240051 RepID=UPI003F49829A